MINSDPIKGIMAICEHLADKNLMTQEEFDEIMRKMK